MRSRSVDHSTRTFGGGGGSSSCAAGGGDISSS
jgi:hypothetical protein